MFHLENYLTFLDFDIISTSICLYQIVWSTYSHSSTANPRCSTFISSALMILRLINLWKRPVALWLRQFDKIISMFVLNCRERTAWFRSVVWIFVTYELKLSFSHSHKFTDLRRAWCLRQAVRWGWGFEDTFENTQWRKVLTVELSEHWKPLQKSMMLKAGCELGLRVCLKGLLQLNSQIPNTKTKYQILKPDSKYQIPNTKY